MVSDVSGILLAGGRGVRFRGDKRIARLAGIPLLVWGAALLGSVADDVVIVTRDVEDIRGRWHYVHDDIPERGPMGGLVTGLRHMQHERAVVLPIDMPLMTVGFLIYLRDAGMETDITVPRWERVEPLAGVYSRTCADHLWGALRRGADSMGDFVQSTALPVRYIGPEEISRFGDPRRIFFNINHPEDLATAEAMMRGEAPAGSR